MKLNPSNSYRWFHCAAFPWFTQHAEKKPPSDEMREGTCAAWVADRVLKGDTSDLTGKVHPNGWVVTPDMVSYVQMYVDHIRSRGGVIASEQRVTLGQHIDGRLDTSTSLSSTTLNIFDLKYGYELVEVFENIPMVIYGAGEYLRINNPAITQVDLTIFQPRAFHPDGIARTWSLSVTDLMTRANEIILKGDRVFEPEPLATPGPHCTRCDAATSCVALTTSVYRDHSYVEDSRQRHMTAEEMKRELDTLDDIEKRLKARKVAVYAEAEQRVMKGEYIAGWGLTQGYGNRVLTVDPKVVTFLTGGVKATEEKPKSPAQLEREGVSPAILKHMTTTPRTATTLKRLPKDYFNKAFKS